MDFDPLILLFVLLGGVAMNLIGKVVIEKVDLPRLLAWACILIPFTITHFVMIDQPVFARVVGLCSVLLLGMKLIVYLEWKKEGGAKIMPCRWMDFSFLWFGMDPRAWTGERKTREWVSHLKWAVFCMFVGALGLSAVTLAEIDYMPLVFIFMSMIFHYGILRLNTAYWRSRGIPVRTLFRNPMVSKGFADFWGNRWNLAYSQMMARAVKRPLIKKIGEKPAVMVVFIVSGIFHEFAITVPAQSGYGLPTLFFLFHGLAVIIEGKGWWLRYICLATLIFGLPILFPPKFVDHVIYPVQDVWKQWISVL